MNSKNLREIELYISKANIEAAIIQFMGSMGFTRGKETIEKVSFDTDVLWKNGDAVPIKVSISQGSYDSEMENLTNYGKEKAEL